MSLQPLILMEITSRCSGCSSWGYWNRPGANIGVEAAVFEATHGSAPKYAGLDKVNPGSIILSAEMMLRYMGWNEAADFIIKGMEGAIQSKKVTYDFARLMPGAQEIKMLEFADVMIEKNEIKIYIILD